MESLVIRLMGPEGAACWQAADAHGAPLGECGEGDLHEAAAAAEGRRVALLIPACEVFRARLDLPARGRRSAVRGARYALEDRIAGDVEELHFAVGFAGSDQLDVAAVERERLEGLLRQADEAGLRLAAVYGEGDALPGLPNATAALLETDALMLRDPGGQVVSAEPGELAALVDVVCAEHAGEEGIPFRLVMFCEPALEDVAREALSNLNGREAELRLLEQGVMPQLAAESVSGGAVNLLQGEFRPRNSAGRGFREAAIALLAAALLYPAYLALDGWRAHREYRALAETVDTRLRQLMPDAGPAAQLRSEFRRRVASGDPSAVTPADGFLRLLRSLDPGGSDRSRVFGLNYSDGAATVRLSAADMETLEQARRRLIGDGYSVLIQTAVPESNGSVVGELSIQDAADR